MLATQYGCQQRQLPLSKAAGDGSRLVLGHMLAWPLCKQAVAAKLVLDQQAHTFQ